MSSEPKTKAHPARAPKQERSQRSFEQVLKASTDLLIEEGYEGFTIQAVSKRSGVSTGSIYARVNSKDDLVHIITARALEARAVDHNELVERARQIPTLAELVPVLILGFAETWRRHATIMRPLFLRAAVDQEVSNAGAIHSANARSDMANLMLAHREEINHPHPERAAEICVLLAYNTISRYLGLGSLVSPDMGDWDELVDGITDAVMRVLRAPADVT